LLGVIVEVGVIFQELRLLGRLETQELGLIHLKARIVLEPSVYPILSTIDSFWLLRVIEFFDYFGLIYYLLALSLITKEVGIVPCES